MPLYSFRCEKCDRAVSELRNVIDRDTTRVCGDATQNGICRGSLNRQLPRIMEPTILDTVDTHRNVKWRKDQDARIKKRAKDHFVKREMDEMIAKAGEKEAKRMGWVTKDGKKNKSD